MPMSSNLNGIPPSLFFLPQEETGEGWKWVWYLLGAYVTIILQKKKMLHTTVVLKCMSISFLDFLKIYEAFQK